MSEQVVVVVEACVLDFFTHLLVSKHICKIVTAYIRRSKGEDFDWSILGESFFC
jgi:hypothetical protein